MITIDEPERMNLLGLLLASLLERRLTDARAARLASRIRGDVAIDASGMCVTLRFEGDGVRVTRATSPRVVASIGGSLTALLGAALGSGIVAAWARGDLRARGNPFTVVRLLSLMRA